jgi:uncharacterized protein
MLQLLKRCLVLCLLLPVALRAQELRNGLITIGRTDSIVSQTLKEKRRLWIYTPPSYNDSTIQPQRYPVLYLLDGNAHFHSVTGMLQILGTGVNGTYVLPEMIVVAIPNTDRTRDMTPSNTSKDPSGKENPGFRTSGGMGNFLRFLETELIPRIDSTYRTAPYRILVGHSLGGITAINALYTIPQAFNAYIAIDPSLWWDNQLLLKQARDRVSKPGLVGRTLYVAHANTLNPTDTTVNRHFNSITQFNRILEWENQSGLRYRYKYYNEDDHGSVPFVAEYDALRFIFAAYAPRLVELMARPANVVEHFARASAALGYTVKPPESMLILLGQYALGSASDTTKALEYYQIYQELYPESPRPYVAQGLALTKRDPARALTYYEKALALKPGDARIKEAIRKLREGQ